MPRRPPITELPIDGLTFAVRRSARRRTIGITVERDGSLRLAVPSRCGQRAIEAAVRGKLGWVRRKLAEYEAMGPPPEPRRFADGERLPYRGRWYGLHTAAAADGLKPAVALRRGRFELSRRAADGEDLAADEAREALVAWYTDQGSRGAGRPRRGLRRPRARPTGRYPRARHGQTLGLLSQPVAPPQLPLGDRAAADRGSSTTSWSTSSCT